MRFFLLTEKIAFLRRFILKLFPKEASLTKRVELLLPKVQPISDITGVQDYGVPSPLSRQTI